MAGFCRDCLTPSQHGERRCRTCGSPRILHHDELDRLAIAHLDCDAFYAAVEKRDDPSLADKPVIIGGGKRGVVATACYVARVRGVHSAMPMYRALKACPDAVVIRPNIEKYSQVSQAVREMMLSLTPQVEPISIDEAFLDMSGTRRLHGAPPAVTLAGLAARIEHELGITVSIGLSFNKFLAKLASDLDKPRGFAVIGEAEAMSFLADLPVGRIWGVGTAMQARLAKDGIRTIGALQGMDEGDLARRYGSIGLRLARLARADDRRTVQPRSAARSVSAERTFSTDIADHHELRARLRALCETVARRLKRAGLAGVTVTLKLRTGDFRTLTRSRQLADPSQLADRIFRTTADMLAREADGTAFRLIGVGVSEFTDPKFADPDDLVDLEADKRARAEEAMEAIRDRFGNRAVDLGLVFESKRGRRDPERGE
ncbi:MAG: DNA polymerase IV [Alphaproteobacteria bacterium]